MNKNQLAAQLYNLRDFCRTAEDLDESLGKVKKIGYNSVQLSGVGPIPANIISDLVKKHDLTICATHISLDRFKNDFDNVVKDHKLWDCQYVGIGSMPLEYLNSLEGIKKFTIEFSEIAKKLNDNGLRFVYHNHNFEFQRIDGSRTIMDILFEETDKDNFEFLLDTYWVTAGGSDPIYWIKKLKNRLSVIHIKDMQIERVENHSVKQIMCEIMEGNLNWDGILKECNKSNVKWYVVEQDTCKGDPFDCLKTSYDNIIRAI